jgi:hypothetical protein
MHGYNLCPIEDHCTECARRRGLPKFAVGERVWWKGGFGRYDQKLATVTGNDGEKNGARVYDLDNGHWAYADQLAKE